MTKDELPPSPYRNILFCTDFSDNAYHAFDYAVDAAARRPQSTLFLLHVIPEPEAQFWKTYIYEVDGIDDKARHDIDERIAADYTSRVPQGTDLRIEVSIGRDYLKILEFARQNHIDAIVMGRAGRSSALDRILFGNVIEKVIRKAECPVLVVPHPAAPPAPNL